MRIDDETGGDRCDASADRAPITGLGETHENGSAGHLMFRPHHPGVECVPHPLLPADPNGDTCRQAPLHGSVRKVERRVCQSRLVVNKVVPCTASTSFRSVSVNPTLASTLREAAFQSQTVAHRRSYPDDRAHSRTANEASVAYP